MTKTKNAPKPKPAERKPVTLKPHQVLLMASGQNAIAMQTWGKFAGDFDLSDLVAELHKDTEKVSAGDLSSVEAMLYGQAMSLQTIFTNLARRSAQNAGEYLDATDKYMRLALKAQAQCRATLETLAEIKNPRPVAFVKQANISNGPQQVNNGTGTPVAPARNSQTSQNELLEHQHGNFLDTAAQSPSGRVDSHMEALGSVNRAKVA